MNSGKKGEEVLPSISPLPCQFLPLSVSIFHHSPSHGSISLTFNFFTSPYHPLSPSHPHLSASVYFSASSSLLLSPLLSPLIFHFLTYFAIHLFLSLLSLSVGFCLLSLSLLLLFYVSIASFCLLTHHMSCCAVNSSGATPGGVTGMSRIRWICIRSICECVQHHRSGTQDEVCGRGNTNTHSSLPHPSVYLGEEYNLCFFLWPTFCSTNLQGK